MELWRIIDSNPFTKIQEFIDQIYSFQIITPQMKMDTYRDIYNSYLGYAHGESLYNHIETCLQNKLKHICQTMNDMQDDDILRLYQKCWNQYKAMSYTLNSGCYRIGENLQQRNGVNIKTYYTIDVLSEQIWERFFFKPLLSFVVQTCLNIIKIHRNDKSSIDYDLIKKTIEIFMDENFNLKMKQIINDNSTINPIDNIYKKYFEIELLHDVEDFYRQQTMPILELDSMITYLTLIAEKLNEIDDSNRLYLPQDTLKVLMRNLGELLVPDDKLNLISDKMKTLISTENYAELSDVYKAIIRIPRIKIQLIKLIESHIHQIGIQQLKNIRTIDRNNLEQYIQIINNIFIKYSTIIKEIFNNDSEILNVLNAVFPNLINEYSIIETTGYIIRSSELLARYCDTLLHKESVPYVIQEMDFEDKIKQMMFVFNYLEDKDIFLKFYKKMLAKRLINQISTSDDDEELIISKLKERCGSDYTSQLERMLQDIRVSRDLVEQCTTHDHINTIDFSIMILTSNVWPFSTSSNIILPPELRLIFKSFTDFYNQQYNGRRLIYLYQYSKGEIRTLFTKIRGYNLQVSMYQMIILLLFNKSSSWTVEQIANETEITEELLITTILSLLENRLLTCSKINNKDYTEINIDSNDIIQISNDFEHNKIKINLINSIKSIKQKDPEKFHRTIDDDRNIIIQAAIIRIMKAQGTLKHTLLIQKVIDQLKSRFTPQIPLIKKCIDILIEKEYLQRKSNDKDILEYLA